MEMGGKANANEINESGDTWTAVTRRTEGRRIAEKRAERIRYAEEYRRKLERESEANGEITREEGLADASFSNEGERLCTRDIRREADERRRSETEARFASAEEKLKSIFSDSAVRTIPETDEKQDELPTDFEENSKKTSEQPTYEPITKINSKNSPTSTNGGEKTCGGFVYIPVAVAPPYIESATAELTALRAEYDRLLETCRQNEERYNAGIEALRLEHERRLLEISNPDMLGAENSRYDDAVMVAATEYGALMGDYISRQKELEAQIEGYRSYQGREADNYANIGLKIDIGASDNAVDEEWKPKQKRSYREEDYSGGIGSFQAPSSSDNVGYIPISRSYRHPFSEKNPYSERETEVREPVEEIKYQPTPPRYTHEFGEKNPYSERETEVREPVEEIKYQPIPPRYTHEFSEKNPYSERETDVGFAAHSICYNGSDDDRVHTYNHQFETASDADTMTVGASYPVPKGTGEPDYRYRYDVLNDTPHYDDGSSAEYEGKREGGEFYVGDEPESYTPIRPLAKGLDKRTVADEHIRFLRESERLEKEKERAESGKRIDTGNGDSTEKAARGRAFAEKSAQVVGARMEYTVDEGERKLEMELLNFSDYSYAEERVQRKRVRTLSKMKRSVRKAKKQEKDATLRYYLIASGVREPSKKKVNTEKLDLVMVKLCEALSRREAIDNRLIELYRGAATKSEAKKNMRAQKLRYKVAKEVHRSLKRKNKRLEKLHAPRDLKNKVRELFNKKIEAHSTLAYSKYILKEKRPKAMAKAELKKDIARSKEALRYVDKDIRRLMKRAEKHNERHKDDISWAIWLIGSVIVVAVLGVCWYFFGDNIKGLFSK